ncbi:MAG TPA: hypothetical protein VGR00_10740 [Thermoanaerobaculia bacterium]|nr:hypothetical protein [Thermoanaerobaculia bacterium]
MTAARTLAILAMLSVLSASTVLAAADHGTYGAKMTFAKGESIVFPDFTLEYRGEKKVPSGRPKRGFVRHDFVATAGAEKQAVSWSSGPGDVGPTIFTIAHKKFWVEIGRSDSAGKLKKNEMVVTYRGPAM